MKIIFTPQRHDHALTLTRSGDSLIINGETFDFSGIPEGATLPGDAIACDWIAGDVERIGGVLHLPLILPHMANAPYETLFPVPITVEVDGPITPLPYDKENEQ